MNPGEEKPTPVPTPAGGAPAPAAAAPDPNLTPTPNPNPAPEAATPAPAAPLPNLEDLLAAVAQQEAADAEAAKAAALATGVGGGTMAYDFRNPMLLTPRQLRKLRLHQEEFVKALASRLSILLRMEFSLKLSSLQTVSCRTLSDSWSNPSQLTLFKIEPLRGISIMEIPPALACAMVDRMMGGRGLAPEVPQMMSEIEQALLEQAVQIFLEEWCGKWLSIKELKPIILGSETNGRFVQAAPAETNMLVVVLEAGLGECAGQIQFGFPYSSVEPLIQELAKEIQSAPTPPAPVTPAPKAAVKWNQSLEDICVPLTAEWDGLELTAREITSLKIGDTIPLDSQFLQQLNVRLADQPKFHGRPGTIAGKWAVELTQPMASAAK